jgi:bacitracin transport system ATP-binding protein
MSDLLVTNNLTKVFKSYTAVNNVNLHVEKGDVYGFIGQNGAGKTTTIRLILSLLKPTAGYVELFGDKVTNNNIYSYLRRIGAMIEMPGFYLNLTGQENLDIHRIMMGIDDKSSIERALNIVKLNEAKDKKVKNYSLGMKQRLGIARTLLHDPELLILDEPTNGLDPKGIIEIRDLIIDISKNQGKTIMISSHILNEVEKMVNKVGIINKGKMLAEVEKDEIQKRCKKSLLYKVDDLKKAVDIINSKQINIDKIVMQSDGFLVNVTDENVNSVITKILVENNIMVKESKIVTSSLEDYFMELTEMESV